jgi:hypothetical protein
MSKRKPQVEEEKDKLTRIAIVSNDKCKPKKCRQECKKSCPVVRMGMPYLSAETLNYCSDYFDMYIEQKPFVAKGWPLMDEESELQPPFIPV